jgi:hypothetical protein
VVTSLLHCAVEGPVADDRIVQGFRPFFWDDILHHDDDDDDDHM